MLRLREVVSGYGTIEILHGVSLTVNEREIVSLIGPNGAGKSTILRTISGLLSCKQGTKTLSGKDITRSSPEKIVQWGIAHVPEGRQIFGELTVLQNLFLGFYSQHRKQGYAGRDRAIEHVYGLFRILNERQNQAAGTLSGGEQQMLAFGRALMADPKVLLLDEPSLGLAPLVVREIFGVIKKLKTTGKAILLAEQNARGALSVADRGYLLELGHIVAEGTCQELANNARVKEVYLGTAGMNDLDICQSQTTV